MDKLDIFSLFLEREKEQGDRTIYTNMKIIRKILRLVSPLNRERFDCFIKGLIVDKRSPSYIKQQISIVRQWGECFGIVELSHFPYPKIKHKSNYKRATFSDEEVVKFLNLPNPWKKLHKRKGVYKKLYEMWIMFYTIKFYHGLRDWEAARLTKDMMRFGLENYIDLPGEITKTGKPRQIPFSPATKEKIFTYVQDLETHYLFPSSKDPFTHIQHDSWRHFFDKQIKRMNIEDRKNLTSYSTRHTYGTRNKKVPIKDLMEIMGHDRYETAMKYQHPTIDDLREVQQGDRINDLHKKGKDMLIDIHQYQKALEDKYRHKIFSMISMSEDGRELNVQFKVRNVF